MAVKIAPAIVFLLTIVPLTAPTLADAGHDDSGFRQCRQNPDRLYDRRILLEEFDRILKTSIPAYAHFPSRGFFVYDLSDPANKYIPAPFVQADACISFINNHVYHFAPVEFAFSQSHIAVLEEGQLKVFKSINCKNSNEQLTDVIAYLEKRLKRDRNREELLTRVRNYRSHGFYFNTDSPRVSCNTDENPPGHDKPL